MPSLLSQKWYQHIILQRWLYDNNVEENNDMKKQPKGGLPKVSVNNSNVTLQIQRRNFA